MNVAERNARLRLGNSVTSRAFIDSLAEGVVLQDLEGVFVDCNDTALRLFETSRDEFIGRTVGESSVRAIHEDGSPLTEGEFPGAITLRTGVALRDVIMGIHTAQGGTRWLSVNSQQVEVDAFVEGVTMTFTDVTRRHQITEELLQVRTFLEESERHLKSLVENISDVVWETDADGEITWVSSLVEQVLGWRPRELLGQTVASLVVGTERERTDVLNDDVLIRRRSSVGEIRFRTADHQDRWMLVSARPVPGGGAVMGLVDVQSQVEQRIARQAQEEHYRMIVEHQSDIVMRTDLDGLITWASPSIVEVFGLRTDEVEGRRIHDLIHPEQVAPSALILSEVVAGNGSSLEVQMRVADGAFRWMLVRINPIDVGERIPTGMVVTVRDVEEEVATRLALAESEQRLRLAIESAPVGMVIEDLDRRIMVTNSTFCEMLGYSPDELVGHRIPEFLDKDDDSLDLRRRAEMVAGKNAGGSIECQLIRADGESIWVVHSLGVLRDRTGLPTSYVSTYIDVTSEKEARELLRYQATHDMLTHLVNRRALFSTAQNLIGRTERTGERVAVLFVDVDHFKNINDQHGHSVGDATLVAVANRMSEACRKDDIVSRLGGDEFAVLLLGLHSIDDAIDIGEKILNSVSEPLLIENVELRVSVSIGVALADPSDTADTTLRNADTALYQAKSAGRGCVVAFSVQR